MAHILVLEDDQVLAERLREDLQGRGHDVTLARNAKEAGQYFVQDGADLILTDIFMEQGTASATDGGVSLVNRVRKIVGSSVPIIAMSGSFGGGADHQIKSTMKTVGVDVMLAKPFLPQELSNLIDELLGNYT